MCYTEQPTCWMGLGRRLWYLKVVINVLFFLQCCSQQSGHVQAARLRSAQACWPLYTGMCVASSPGHCTSMLASSQCSLVPRPLPNLFRRCSNFNPRQNLGTRLVYMYIILLVSFSDFCCIPPAFVVNEHGAKSLAGVSGNLQEF